MQIPMLWVTAQGLVKLQLVSANARATVCEQLLIA